MRKVYIYVLITAFMFGSMEVSCKIGGADLDPFQLTFLRFAIGGLILLPFALTEMKRRDYRPSARDLLALLGVGIIGVPVSMVLFQISVMISNASTVAVLICTSPFFTMVFAHLLTEEKMNREKLAILAVAMVAIFCMLRPWDVQEGNTMGGMLLMLLAALFFGLYTVCGAICARRMGLIVQTSISFLMGSGVLLIIILCMGRPVLAGVTDNIPIVLYVGVMVTGFGYFCYFKAIELSDAATGSLAFFLKPAIAGILSRVILHEVILWNTLLGIGLILAASLLNILRQKRMGGQARAEEKRQARIQAGRLAREEERPGDELQAGCQAAEEPNRAE